MRIIRWLEKIRRIFASDKTYSKRDKAGLARNTLWDGVYYRLKTSKDGWGAIPKDYNEKNGK